MSERMTKIKSLSEAWSEPYTGPLLATGEPSKDLLEAMGFGYTMELELSGCHKCAWKEAVRQGAVFCDFAFPRESPRANDEAWQYSLADAYGRWLGLFDCGDKPSQ